MNSLSRRGLAFVLLPVSLIGCGAPPKEPTFGPDLTANALAYQAVLDADQRAWVESTLSQLTVQEMAAQVIVAWVPGNYVAMDSDEFDEAAALVEQGIGGLWLMGGLPRALSLSRATIFRSWGFRPKSGGRSGKRMTGRAPLRLQ